MGVVRITKEFHFEAAHALWKYDGKCKNLHGHSYKLSVTVKGSPINDSGNVKNGMLIDFGDLKSIVNQNIINVFDHAVIVSNQYPYAKLNQNPEIFERLIVSDYQPTCENMLIEFAEILKSKLPAGLQLFSLKLHETANSFGEWYADDNL